MDGWRPDRPTGKIMLLNEIVKRLTVLVSTISNTQVF